MKDDVILDQGVFEFTLIIEKMHPVFCLGPETSAEIMTFYNLTIRFRKIVNGGQPAADITEQTPHMDTHSQLCG